MKNLPLSLYLILDPAQCLHHHPIDVLEQAIEGGISCVQYRDKSFSDHSIAIAQDARKICGLKNIPFIVNDSPTLADKLDADGCHLGEDDPSPQQARDIIGQNKIIGLTLKKSQDPFNITSQIKKNNCDYICIGPVFQSSSKTHEEPLFIGIDGLFSFLNFCREKIAVDTPICAISGISLDNAEEVFKTGIDGIAVISAICSAEEPLEATKLLREIFLSTNRTKTDIQ